MPRIILSGLLLLLSVLQVSAKDALMVGGSSPNNRYKVFIRQTNSEPSDYEICLQTSRGKLLAVLTDTGGILGYVAAVDTSRAVWHRSSRFVAFTGQGTRHTREIYVLAIYPDHAERLKLPDYVHNALKKVNATSLGSSCVSTLKHWHGDLLVLHLYFKDAERGPYSCEVDLALSHQAKSHRSIELKGINHMQTAE